MDHKIHVYEQIKKAVKNSLKHKEILESDLSHMTYMDPRISVAWCKVHGISVEKIFDTSLVPKFAWAMDAQDDFKF
ncbi:hypothetical protein Bca52824_035965 [Brassica carinata]|uniref:Topoisomerase I C-terminal domain-containing protein n=1 Tax=Brassica carinata TaxID=52824 RepID=A0A8X7S576_BRACI|nr:hypothetical protein Bca52824_035965 [Brassica carinata]